MDVYAQVNIADQSINPVARFSDFSTIVNQITPILTSVASIFFLAMLGYGAYNIITAGGEAEKIAKAQKTFFWAIIGITVVMFAYLITRLIFFILNAETEFGFTP